MKKTPKKVLERLEYLRECINEGNISYSELGELAYYAQEGYIEETEVLLREWAGIEESND